MEAIRKKVWNGRIPLCIHFPQEDPDRRYPIHLMVPRIFYVGMIPLLVPHLTGKETWFSYNDLPLKWHYPLGLVYDQYKLTHSSANPNESKTSIIFNIKVNFIDYPTDRLIPLLESATLVDPNQGFLVNYSQDYFMSALKESDFIHNGSVKRIMGLSKPDQTSLWISICNDDFDAYNQSFSKLIDRDVPPRNIPFRIYYGQQVLQDLISPERNGNLPTTLNHLLETILMPLLDASSDTPLVLSYNTNEIIQKESKILNDGSSAQDHIFIEVDSQSIGQGFVFSANDSKFKVKTHGIYIHLETPLLWLSNAMAYPDGFLHLVIEK